MSIKPIDMNEWIEANKTYFLPPICNKLMHNSQLKVFFVGGPNQRKDYHIEEGEELFYMIRGDMCLKVIENEKSKDVVIREGQVFLLPARIPHSPQRFTDTIGLVIERERLKSETDSLRYLIEGTTDVLYERWFYCSDLGSQLVPIIQQYHDSEQYRTGKPTNNSKLRSAPYLDDKTRQLTTPFGLYEWLHSNKAEIDRNGFKSLFGDNFKSKITIFGANKTHQFYSEFETFFLQLKNDSVVNVDSKEHNLVKGNTLLIPKQIRCTLNSVLGSYTLAVSMPTKININPEFKSIQ